MNEQAISRKSEIIWEIIKGNCTTYVKYLMDDEEGNHIVLTQVGIDEEQYFDMDELNHLVDILQKIQKLEKNE